MNSHANVINMYTTCTYTSQVQVYMYNGCVCMWKVETVCVVYTSKHIRTCTMYIHIHMYMYVECALPGICSVNSGWSTASDKVQCSWGKSPCEVEGGGGGRRGEGGGKEMKTKHIHKRGLGEAC